MRSATALFAAILLAAASAASAADLTWTYTASMSTTNGLTDGGITVTPTYEWKVDESFGTSSGMLQIGKTSHNVLSVTYAFSAFPSRVKSIAITGKTASGNSGQTTVSATIGGEAFTGSASLTNGVGTVLLLAPDGPQTGTVSLLIDNPKANTNNGSSQAVYLSSIVVTYENPEPDDPWNPEWTVGTPSPVPTIGKAFSFGVSAALADGTPQTVSFGGLTPAATGAQFADGVFSWTPGADAAGDYSAAFSVQNTGGTYTTNVAFTVRGETEDVELFWEDFPNYDNAWSSTEAVGLPTTDTRVAGWTGEKLYKARSAMKLGKASDYGSATTPAIETANGAAATVKLSLDAAAYAEKTGTLEITATDADTSAVLFSTNVVLTAMASNKIESLSEYPIGPFSFAAAGTFKVTFVPVAGDGRMGIDSVKVTQSVSTSLVDLDVPTGLAVVEGTLSTNSFSVSWNAVANATNYAAEVYAPGGTAPVASTKLAAPPAAFAGLADDTDYRVRVRAEGDTSLYTFSAWTNVVVRTARSAEHPTLSFGGWTNSVGDGKLYAGIANVAAVSALRDNGTNATVTLESVLPAPVVGPTFEDGVLSWTPDDADTNKTFTVSFLMDGTYATNLSFKVLSVPFLHAPDVEANPVAWNAFTLKWDVQSRAAGYGVRVWTDCPNPGATATRVEERFPSYYKKGGGGNRPAGWIFRTTGVGYDNVTAPVQFSKDGNWMATYDLGGPISSVSFFVKGNSMANGSTLRVFWAGALTDAEMENKDNWTNHLLAAVSNLVSHDQTVTAPVPAGADARRIVWQYEQHDGNVGVGQVAIEGTGFSTPKWLPGWGPAEKDVGLVQSCTVAKPRPGKALGPDPANPKEDLTVPRTNYAEVRVRDAAGTTLATVVAVKVPAPPRSARATMLIAR